MTQERTETNARRIQTPETYHITDSRIPAYAENEVYIPSQSNRENFLPGFFDETECRDGFFMDLY